MHDKGVFGERKSSVPVKAVNNFMGEVASEKPVTAQEILNLPDTRVKAS